MSQSEKFLHEVLNVLNGSEVTMSDEGGPQEFERWLRSLSKSVFTSNSTDFSVGSDLDVKAAREAETRAKSLLLRVTQEFMEQKRQQSRLETSLNELRNQILTRETELASLRDESERQKKTRHLSDVATAQQQHALKELRDRQAALVQEIDSRDRQVTALKKDYDQRVANFNCERDEMLSQYETEMARLRKEAAYNLEQLRSELKTIAKSELEAKIAQKNAELTSVQATLQRKLVKMGDDCWAKDIELERLSKAEKSLTEKLMTLSQEQAAREKTFANESREAFANFSEEKTALADELADVLSETKELRRERETYESARQELKKELREQQEAFRQQAEELIKARQEVGTTRVESQHVRMECERQIAGLRQDYEVKITAAEIELQHATERLVEANEIRARFKVQSEELALATRELGEQKLETQHARLDADRQLAGLRQDFDMQLEAVHREFKHSEELLKEEAKRTQMVEKQLVEARLTIEDARQQYLDLREKEFTLRREFENGLRTEQGRTASFELEANLAKKRVESLEGKLTQAVAAADQLQSELERRDEKFNAIESELRTEQGRASSLELEARFAKKSIRNLESELTSARKAIEEFELTLEARDEKIEELETLLRSTQGHSSQLEGDRDAKVAVIESLEKQLRNSEERANGARKQVQELETAVRSSRVFAEHVEAERDSKINTIAALETQIRLLDEKAEADRQKVLAAEAATRGVQAHLESVEEIRRAQDLAVMNLQSELQLVETKAREAARQAEDAQRECEHLKAAKEDVVRDRSVVETHFESLTARESQLGLYAKAMSREKGALSKFAIELAQEMRTIASTHPLRDYIAATEYELGKTEFQLKTMPMLAIDRPKFENAMSQLMEQRDFLKGVLAHTQREFESRATELQKRANSGFLAAVPPPPPSAAAPKKTMFAKVPDFIEARSNRAVVAAPLVSEVTAAPVKEVSPGASEDVEAVVKWTALDRDLA